MKCTNPNCGYEWVSRKEQPKACPKCHQYINYAGKVIDTLG